MHKINPFRQIFEKIKMLYGDQDLKIYCNIPFILKPKYNLMSIITLVVFFQTSHV